MSAYTLLLQAPEIPLTEVWTWPSDVITTDNGEEQRISLAPTPRRRWAGSFEFASDVEIRRHLATMFNAFRDAFDWPLYHQVVKLKAKTIAGATTFFCTTSRTELRVGQKVLLVEGDKNELLTIATVLVDRFTTTGGAVNAYTARAQACPVVSVYSTGNAAFVRRAANGSGTSTFSFFATGFLDPFIADADKVVLQTFNGLPVLNRRAVGEEFNSALITGMEETQFDGVPTLRNRWLNPQYGLSVFYNSDRVAAPLDWRFWRTFADYCRGAVNPFYVPTFRDDGVIFTAPASGAGTLVLTGREYRDHYWPVASFRTIVITKPDGTQHFATVTNVTNSAGNDLVAFTPAVPVGDWTGATFSLLLRCRLGDGIVSIEHYGTFSTLALNLRTVPI